MMEAKDKYLVGKERPDEADKKLEEMEEKWSGLRR
jgi:hypothetical protein